jgi:uracil-DNA glycosylase family 4
MTPPKKHPVCSQCPLFERGIPVPDRYPNPLVNRYSGLSFIGEQPGFEEVRKQTPFIGPSGRLLWSICNTMGLVEDEIHVTNAVR